MIATVVWRGRMLLGSSQSDEQAYRGRTMKLFVAVLLWLIAFAYLPLIAVTVIVLLPIAWVLILPFRLVSIAVESLLSFVKAILMLPARMLGAN